MVSPRFGDFPASALLGAPSVLSDAEIPTPTAGVSCFFNATDQIWRLKRTDGVVVDIGPTDIPSSTALRVRAIASFDGEAGTPAILFQLGDSEAHPSEALFTGISRISPGSYALATVDSDLANNDTVVVVTARPVSLAPIAATYSLSASSAIFVQTWTVDLGVAIDASFSVIVYTTSG